MALPKQEGKKNCCNWFVALPKQKGKKICGNNIAEIKGKKKIV